MEAKETRHAQKPTVPDTGNREEEQRHGRI
jgi:hypothetical protein